MAQGTGTDRRLAPRVKTASARAILALAVAAALALSGCGGDSSEDETASSSQPPASEQGAGGGAASAEGKEDGESSKDGAPSPSQKGAPGAAGSGDGKQGPRISEPEGEQEPGFTPQQRQEATVANILLKSPAIEPAAAGSLTKLPAPYTCDGKDSWPALEWRGVPSDAAELLLFAIGLEPVEEALFFNWSVAGLDPSLEGIDAGELPKGAVLGRNGYDRNGYSICPAAGPGETYIFTLFAIPEALSPGKGFDPKVLREEAQAQAGNSGVMAVFYGRG